MNKKESEYTKEIKNLDRIRLNPIQYFKLKRLYMKGLGFFNLFKTIECYKCSDYNRNTLVVIRHEDNLFCISILLLFSFVPLLLEGLTGFKHWMEDIFKTKHRGQYVSKYFDFDLDSIQTKEPYIFLESLVKDGGHG